MDASTIDIVCNLFTEREVALRAGSVDAKFFDQVRIEAESQKGVPLEDFIGKMDAASINWRSWRQSRPGRTGCAIRGRCRTSAWPRYVVSIRSGCAGSPELTRRWGWRACASSSGG